MKKHKRNQIRILNFTIQRLILQICFISLFMLLNINYSYAQNYSNINTQISCGDNYSGATSSVLTYAGVSSDAFIPTNPFLTLSVLVEGYWNDSSMVSDTIRCYLRNSSSPYNIVDSGKGLINTSGQLTIGFLYASVGTYYIQVKHRNSIETWSASAVSFISGVNNYNFTTASTQAYGSNLILKGNKFCIYSGDVDQDGNIDLTDVVSINNDAGIYSSGYLVTDLNGDFVTDITDLLMGFNNSSIFIAKVTP